MGNGHGGLGLCQWTGSTRDLLRAVAQVRQGMLHLDLSESKRNYSIIAPFLIFRFQIALVYA